MRPEPVITLVDSNVLLDVATADTQWQAWSTAALAEAANVGQLAIAGKAFLAHRCLQGERGTPMPDFYIGAHAAISRLRLLTRDPRRYRTYFPTIDLVAPPSG